ncbi:RabGAP/TBC [Fomitiporia mediterranea MF3/22]|uniref:RabGAP/TBC n=1 Tax=Fomitiporia mediterranea (strain MF3/22) TaxID=694068 RepID=UPI0004408ED9|nr:RabGAP/TBC [Fomitiporia mediterranea MF3/22]EJD04193.1 RabGAP/TBC [Fomitiporia mediterranea MF3/22]
MTLETGHLQDSDDDKSAKPGAASDSRRFSIDEAFSDGGEDNFEFSSESIRRELERNAPAAHPFAGDEEINFENIQIEPSYNETDTSISTLDINAPPVHTPDPATVSLPHSPGTPEHSSEADHPNHEDASPSPKGEDSSPDGSAHHSFPSVVIDLSRPPASQVTVLSDNSSESSQQHPITPSDSANVTSEALPSPKRASMDAGIPNSQSLPISVAVSRPQVHRVSKSTGPSALEKVISKTRPTFLPPKPKEEDLKHLADWEIMMKKSREAQARKRKLREERRLARERLVEESTSIWEQQIVPDWKNAVRDPKLRKLWWHGIPPKLRGMMWERAVGNDLALNTYRTCLARASRALAAGTFPTTTLNLIDADIRSTLPTLHIFTPTAGPMYQDLLDMLCAWVVSRSDEGLGYVMGASKIAAMLLLNMQPASAFVTMRNLVERHCMRSFYGGLSCKEEVDAYYRIFDTLLADCMPKVYFNFKQHQISPAAYFPEWIIPLFLDHLSLEACARIWDVLVLEGDSFLFRAALAILASLESRLFFPDRQELLSLLSGENKAAIEVAKRDGTLMGNGKYEIFGLDEENVWERIEGLEGWWKDSTWARLLQRELPDL